MYISAIAELRDFTMIQITNTDTDKISHMAFVPESLDSIAYFDGKKYKVVDNTTAVIVTFQEVA